MARKLRVEYPGAIYHVMNRGDRREPILRDDEDRERFLATLGEACGRSGWQVHAYVSAGTGASCTVAPRPTYPGARNAMMRRLRSGNTTCCTPMAGPFVSRN